MFGLPQEYDVLVRGLVLSVVGLAWILLVVRIVGLRTLSKMTAIDFVVTLATGSLLATACSATGWRSFAQAIVAIGALNLWQYLYARARQGSKRFRDWAENDPVLLVRDGRYLHAAMKEARVSEADIRSKLRESNISGIDAVDAVVLEATGDISILTRDPPVERDMLKGVRNQ